MFLTSPRRLKKKRRHACSTGIRIKFRRLVGEGKGRGKGGVNNIFRESSGKKKKKEKIERRIVRNANEKKEEGKGRVTRLS